MIRWGTLFLVLFVLGCSCEDIDANATRPPAPDGIKVVYWVVEGVSISSGVTTDVVKVAVKNYTDRDTTVLVVAAAYVEGEIASDYSVPLALRKFQTGTVFLYPAYTGLRGYYVYVRQI